jgi:hypothetical protein
MMQFPYRTLGVLDVGSCHLVIYNWDDLSDATSPKPYENAQLIDVNGTVCWTVYGMSRHANWNSQMGTFVGFRMRGGRPQLTSFSGNSYDVDMKTGAVTFAELAPSQGLFVGFRPYYTTLVITGGISNHGETAAFWSDLSSLRI